MPSAISSLLKQVRHPKDRAFLLQRVNALIAQREGAASQERVIEELSSGRAVIPAFEFLFSDQPDNPGDGSPTVRYRAAWGGRGSAKSTSFARALLILGAKRKLRILCAREIQKSIAASVKKLLDDHIEALGLADFYDSKQNAIVGRNGTEFAFAGLRANPQSVKSTEGMDIVWVEEANTVSKGSLTLLTPTIRKPGSEIWATWNPKRDTDPIDALFRGPLGPPPGSIVRQVNFDENPYFPEVLRVEKDWTKKRDPDAYAHIWLGGYERNSEARVFKNWRVADEPFEAPVGTVFYQGADWGYSQDPTVLVRCYIDGRTLYVVDEAYMIGCEIDDTPALFDTIPNARDWLIIGDSENPQSISYLRRQNFRIVSATKGPGSVEEGIRFLKSYDIVVHPRCVHTIDELSLYSFKVDPLTELVTPILSDKDNHVIDALRYAVEPLRGGGAGEGFFEFMRQEAAAVVQRQAKPLTATEIQAADDGSGTVLVGLIPPPGISVAYGAMGDQYSPDANGVIWFTPEDAGPYRGLHGWRAP